jgi:hypothetical protein
MLAQKVAALESAQEQPSDLLIWGLERVEGRRTYLHAETGFGESSSEGAEWRGGKWKWYLP